MVYVKTFDEAIDLMLNANDGQKYAFIWGKIPVAELQQTSCDITTHPAPFLHGKLGVTLSKHSPLTPLFSYL